MSMFLSIILIPVAVIIAFVTLMLLAWGTKIFVRYMDDA